MAVTHTEHFDLQMTSRSRQFRSLSAATWISKSYKPHCKPSKELRRRRPRDRWRGVRSHWVPYSPFCEFTLRDYCWISAGLRCKQPCCSLRSFQSISGKLYNQLRRKRLSDPTKRSGKSVEWRMDRTTFFFSRKTTPRVSEPI